MEGEGGGRGSVVGLAREEKGSSFCALSVDQ